MIPTDPGASAETGAGVGVPRPAPVPRRRDEALAHALDATLTSIWDNDVAADRVTLDPNWSRMRGGPPVTTVAPIGELLQAVHPADRTRARRAFLQCVSGRTDDYSQEFRVRDAQGGWLWVYSCGRVRERDAAGRAVRMIGTNIDVTQRKATEQAAVREASFLRALNLAALALLERRTKDEMLTLLAGQAADLLGAALVEVALVDRDELVYAATAGTTPPPALPPRASRSQALLSWRVIDTGEPVVVPDYAQLPGSRPEYVRAGFRSVAVFPILYGEASLGVLVFMRLAGARDFSAEDREKGVLLAQLAALALHNASIYDHALQLADARTQALRESERHYRDLVESVKHAYYVADRKSLFTYCNPAFKLVGGYEPTELLGQSSFRLVAEEDRHRVMTTYREWLADPARTHARCEFRVNAKDGRQFWVEQTTTFVRDAAGRVVEGRNLLQDITERKVAEAVIQESEELFRAVFDNSPVAIALLTLPEGRIVKTNKVAETVFGHTTAEAIGRTSAELGLWVDLAERERYVEAMRRERRVPAFEARMRRKDGSVFVALYSGSIVTIRGRQYTLNAIQDITAQKQAEQALRESEAKFKSVYDVSPIPIILLTYPEGRILSINPAATDLFGYQPEEAYTRTTTELNIWADPAARQSFMELLRTRDRLSNHAIDLRRKDGRIIHAYYSVARLQLGNVPCMLTSVIDITAQKQAEHALRVSEAQLRQAQKMESLGTLAGGIAHDFNNILTGILGYTQLALVDLDERHPARQWLEGTLKSGERAKNLVSQILTFSRKTESTRSQVRLQQVLVEAVELLHSSLPAMVKLEADINPACAPVHANANEFHQVVLNLCTNAWHALPPQGGRIAVSLQPAAVSAEFAAAHAPLQPGPHVRLAVRDNGSGMSAATIERIFEPFFTTKEAGKGTGLGLAVVHSVVTAHGGGVFVQSEPGVGTLFEIYVPTSAGEEPAPVQATGPDLPRGAGEHVLVVDDEPASGSVITRLIERLGYRATYCADPRAALELLRGTPFALLVTDLAMPDLPGDELTRQALQARPGLPVLLLSGFIEPATRETLRQRGVREVLAKPPGFPELAAALRRCLAR